MASAGCRLGAGGVSPSYGLIQMKRHALTSRRVQDCWEAVAYYLAADRRRIDSDNPTGGFVL